MPGQELVAAIDTPYEQVAIARLENQLTVYGDGLPIATIPDPYETPSVIYRLIAQAPNPHRILFVATPTNGLASELIRALDERPETAGSSVTFVYADEQLVRTLASFLPAEERLAIGGRIRLVRDDPRAFLRTTTESFDLLFIDAPEPTAAHVNRFYTTEFYAAAKRALSSSGVLCFRIPSSADYIGREVSELSVSVHKALSLVFPKILVTPGEQSFFFASSDPGQITDDPALIAARLNDHPGALAFRDDIVLDYEPGHLKRLGELMTSGNDAIANSDDHPSSYYYGAVLWERFSSEQPTATSWLARAHAAVRSLALLHLVLAGGLVMGLWLISRAVLARRAAALDASVTVAIAGFTSMALNLVLLVAYQSMCGALYQRIAVMSALLMFGVAIGSGATGRIAPQFRKPSAAAGAVLVSTAVFAFLLPTGLRWLDNMPVWAEQTGYAFLFVATGTLLGAVYPTIAQVLLSRSASDEHRSSGAGGLIDALDHLGAAVGAITVGSVILPAIGGAATLRLIAGLTVAVGGVWVVQSARARPTDA
jgi:spermidine synthase